MVGLLLLLLAGGEGQMDNVLEEEEVEKEEVENPEDKHEVNYIREPIRR